MAMKKQIEFELSDEDKFEYGKKGNLATATFITLSVPTSANMNECALLKQAFFHAIRDQAKLTGSDRGSEAEDDEDEDDDDSTLDGETIMKIIIVSDVELITVLIAAKILFTSGIAMVDGETKLTVPLIEKLPMDTLERMTGEYMANFILASELQKQKNR